MRKFLKLILIVIFIVAINIFTGCGGFGSAGVYEGSGEEGASSYIVNFNSTGGSAVSSAKVSHGGKVSAPIAPKRTNYNFDGWYSDSGRTAKITFPYAVTKNITFYAKWVMMEGVEICTLVIREKSGITTTDYPLTFGHVFRIGDVPFGTSVVIQSGGSNLASQFDVKSTYPDGSIRHAVISVRIPRITKNEDLSLSLVGMKTPSMNKAYELDKSSILAMDIDAAIKLNGLNGSGYSGNLSANLKEAISQSKELNYWLKGEVCTEILVKHDINRSLNALWEVRIYPGTPYIRISHSIENINWQSRGNINYSVSIYQGTTNPVQVYSKQEFQHNQSARWRKVFWLGQALPEVEIRYDLPYMISTGMVMPYDTSLDISENTIASQYKSWQASKRDLMENGLLFMYFPTTGGRAERGILPRWAALYLLSMDNRMREILLGHGEISGHIPIHYREDDLSKKFYGHTVSINDRPNFAWLNNSQLPSIGETRTGWTPDQPHQGSFAYLPYLITGERWFLDEIYYWAGWNLLCNRTNRDGTDFKPGADFSFGTLSSELRGVAWALRNISDAAAVALDSDIEKDYFKSKIINNLEWMMWRNDPTTTGHGLGAVRHNGSLPRAQPPWPTAAIGPWQHDFMVLVLADMARKHEDLPDASILRDLFGKYTIGRFTNPDIFSPFNGAGYYWPLRDKLGDLYTDADWDRYWSDVAEMNSIKNSATRFTGLDNAGSYAAIALGASAMLTHLEKGDAAYKFLRENLSYNKWAPTDPTWTFVTPHEPPVN